MVDREARRRAAALVREMRDGNITNDDFQAAWPSSTRDRVLRAIAATLWASYSDRYTHFLEGRYALTDYGRAFFDRSALFLESGLEYEWPRDRFYAGVFPLSALVFSLGMLLPAFIILKRRHAEQESAGHSDVWPFIDRSDYARAHEGP